MSTFLIKDYVVNRKRIGKGSFSTIYKAFNTKDSKDYAIKEVLIDKKSIKSNVKREFLVLKKLNHPNIVKLHDLIIDTNYNNIYFVFDYFKNGDLANFLDNKPLKEKYCKKYSKQLADGLKYLIENNILHRDLKPQNILLTDDFNIKIADFGFARKVEKDMLLNTLCGSPMYMAPEIINKQDYSIKSDLWSVGIIIYQMIFGRVPFDVSNFVQLIKKINTEQICFQREGIEISSICLDLIQNLLKLDVDDRISWDNFFYHPWFNENQILLEENNLLEFSISNNSSVPKLNNFEHHIEENQFASFIHKSIKLKESYKEVSNKARDQEQDDIEINFLESLNESNEYISCDSVNGANILSDDEVYDESDGEDDIDFNTPYEHNYYTRSKVHRTGLNQDDSFNKTKPIEIPNSQKTNYLNNEYEYEFIDKDAININQQSAPVKNRTITESFKEYLYESVSLLKHSYKYITNNKSI
jgi:serine/threonine protein kinase